MDVIHAIGSPPSAVAAVPFRERGTIRDRFAAFIRHPIAVVRTNLEELPFDYPPSVMISADAALIIVVGGAMIQRHDYFPTVLPLAAAMLVFVSVPMFCFFGLTPSPILLAASGLGATAIFLLQPVSADFAPFVLVVVVGEVAAIVAKRWSALFAVLAMLELVAFDAAGYLYWNTDGHRLQGIQMYTIGVALGWLVGVMLQYQRRFLYQERESQAIRATRAADEERGRIAREVHDVIAHSLSVTLLHLTAARHALQTDRDVDDAVEALVDAERLGRQAMADIRRTIGLLDNGQPSKHAPEPGLGDIDDLVTDVVRAGLDVRSSRTGDVGAVSPAVGLALYRIAQESLANVVKHAPGASVTVRLVVDAGSARLSVDNTLPQPPPRERPGGIGGNGMGLDGMRQRAELLGGAINAGPYDDGWSVRAEFPIGSHRGMPSCPLPGLINGVSTALRDGARITSAATAREGM
ncbi:sensor histidine kinase [Nocardia arizonensis]|uniref:sensor histidine kinase n=1 Tax=Nocardia arizonensis TaxID=1141647 RepID=UPI0009EA467B|nr:histidine kinase [Nocardia arizonensis]